MLAEVTAPGEGSTVPATMAYEELLARTDFFGGAAPALLRDLAAQGSELPLIRGDVLFREGDMAESLYLVVSGRIAIVIANPIDHRETVVALMDSGPEVTGPVNLGNPREFTMEQLARMIIDLTGSRSELAFKPLPQDDPKQRQPDIGLARSALGWEPQISLEDGLGATIDYFRALA